MRLLIFTLLVVVWLVLSALFQSNFFSFAQTKLEKEVQEAIIVAQQNIARKVANLTIIKESGARSQTQKANSDAQEEQARGVLLAEVSKILVQKNGREILSQLSTVDVNSLIEKASVTNRITVAGKGYDGGSIKRCSGDALNCAFIDK